MSKHWKCKLGFHDWEQIDYKSHSALENKMIREVTKNKLYLGIERFPDTYYQDKICLRCSRRIDEITAHNELILLKYNKKLKRKSQRNTILYTK